MRSYWLFCAGMWLMVGGALRGDRSLHQFVPGLFLCLAAMAD